MDIIKSIEHEQLKSKIPELRVGNTVKVHQRIKEGNRERIQVFEGIIIKRQGGSSNATFTVRRLSYGVGVEKTFLVHSPLVEKVELVRVGKARRAKLFYLRDRVGKAAKTKEKVGARIENKEIILKEEIIEEPVEEVVEEVLVEEVVDTKTLDEVTPIAPEAEEATAEEVAAAEITEEPVGADLVPAQEEVAASEKVVAEEPVKDKSTEETTAPEEAPAVETIEVVEQEVVDTVKEEEVEVVKEEPKSEDAAEETATEE